jgi:predicted membrane metal-binding protein
LSENLTNLIITTVTGDKNYESAYLKNLYKELQILHLLVLSGSNLVIFSQFFSFLYKRDSLSYFINQLLANIVYFCYIGFLHPVARALIFMQLFTFLDSFGMKSMTLYKILTLSVCSVLFYIFSDFSVSFLLSFIFSTIVVFYNTISSKLIRSKNYIFKVFIFGVYMTAATIPINLFFFKNINILQNLVSNLFLTPFYDFFVLIMYVIYFLSFFPDFVQPVVFYLSKSIALLLLYIEFLFTLNGYIMS